MCKCCNEPHVLILHVGRNLLALTILKLHHQRRTHLSCTFFNAVRHLQHTTWHWRSWRTLFTCGLCGLHSHAAQAISTWRVRCGGQESYTYTRNHCTRRCDCGCVVQLKARAQCSKHQRQAVMRQGLEEHHAMVAHDGADCNKNKHDRRQRHSKQPHLKA